MRIRTDEAKLLLVAFLLPMLAMVGACLTLAYPLQCWPGFMRAKRLEALDGIEARELSNQGMRRWMKRPSFWTAFAKGVAVVVAVVFVFVTPWFLLTWATSRKGFPEGYVFPSLLTLGFSGGLAAKAWVVRQLVDERGEARGPST